MPPAGHCANPTYIVYYVYIYIYVCICVMVLLAHAYVSKFTGAMGAQGIYGLGGPPPCNGGIEGIYESYKRILI